jgi:hypothetical protein
MPLALLTNPITLRLLFVVSLIVTILGAYEYGKYTQRKDDGELIQTLKKSCEGEKTKLELEYQLKVDGANNKAREIEQSMLATLDEANRKAAKERQDAQTTINILTARINAGALKLYVPVLYSTSWDKLQTPSNPSLTLGAPTEVRAQLLPATASALVSLSGRCDQAVRERNQLIDTYEELRSKYNALTQSKEPESKKEGQ